MFMSFLLVLLWNPKFVELMLLEKISWVTGSQVSPTSHVQGFAVNRNSSVFPTTKHISSERCSTPRIGPDALFWTWCPSAGFHLRTTQGFAQVRCPPGVHEVSEENILRLPRVFTRFPPPPRFPQVFQVYPSGFPQFVRVFPGCPCWTPPRFGAWPHVWTGRAPGSRASSAAPPGVPRWPRPWRRGSELWRVELGL